MMILDYLQTIMPLSKEISERIHTAFTTEELPRKTVLYQEGQLVKRLYFVSSGLLRMYYLNQHGKEITYGFYTDKQFVTIPESFFNQTPSRYYLELLENSEISHISFENFDALIKDFPDVKVIENYVLRFFLTKASERIVALQFQSAEERYLALTESQPSILLRAPLGTIASYLGITQETLSRIRAKK